MPCHAAANHLLGTWREARVDLGIHLDIDPEKALTSANYKFERRFRDMELAVIADGKRFKDFNMESLDRQWRAAKKRVG